MAKALQERLAVIRGHLENGHITVMILGLGSVGTYLLDYLAAENDPALRIVVVGRDCAKMERNVNIVRISALIRQKNRSHIDIEDGVDFNDVSAVCRVVGKYRPDFIVNSSRAYAGLKYGSISWEHVRAYGIWTPLAVHFTRNIMQACERADADAVVINTSYSDAVVPWLKNAGQPCPDFGSGNFNHLVPRIRYAVAEILGIEDFWNVGVMFAAGHFHDVCISKEGQTEGVKLPLRITYHGEATELPQDAIFSKCKIPMPVDAQRNMMNASSNFDIIMSIVDVLRNGGERLLFIPGAFGNTGGYPVRIGMRGADAAAWIDESVFSFEEMQEANRRSMYLDGVEDFLDGALVYTDELIEKARRAFGVRLPKMVPFEEADEVADFIIEKIIRPQLAG